MLLCFSSLYSVALAGGAAALRLYSRKVSSMDKCKRKRKLSIVHCQSSIFYCFGLVLVSVKRRNEVERPERRCLSRRRGCGAHSETERRSSSADAALNFWFFSFKRKKRTITWVKPKERRLHTLHSNKQNMRQINRRVKDIKENQI